MTATDMLPIIHRARGYRLYDRTRRYVDFWQENGHAILGHRPGRVRLEIKQQLDRGLLAAYPNRSSYRLLKALSALLPARQSFRWYSSFDRCRLFIEDLLGTPFGDRLPDPALGERSNDVMLWRPWLSEKSNSSRVVVPVLPMPGTSWLSFVAVADVLPDEFHPSDPVSPVCSSSVSAAIFELIAKLKGFDDSGWGYFDSALWIRRGPYLSLRCEEPDFRALFRDFLSHGMILAPDWRSPSIIPGSYDPGEVKPIRQLEQR
jgi:hypothetical protein